MSDDKHNLSEAGKTTLDNPIQGQATVADEWETVSLPDYYLIYGGAANWNFWRRALGKKIRLDNSGKEHVKTLPSLSGFNLIGMDLSGYDLKGKELVETDFTGSLLKETKFIGSDLRCAKFNQTDLTGADFTDTRLTGAVFGEETKFEAIKATGNVTVGINGIYVRRTSKHMGEESESAALMTLIPAGDSMKGHSSEAVLENLKHARQLNTASILLVSIVTTILVFQITDGEVKLPVLELKLPVGKLSIVAQLIALVYQFLVLGHIREAADGAKYLQTREDAMKVGSFPWGISNYPGKKPDFAGNARHLFRTFNGWWPWFSNELNRAVTAFHPILFMVGGGFYFYQHRERYGSISQFLFKPTIFLLLIVLLFVFSWLIYRESRRFKRPIVFDAEAEKAPRGDLARIADSLTEQLNVTKRLASFIETAVPRYANPADRFSDRLPGGVEISMRRILAGHFEMGSDNSDDEKPQHQVVLQQFWMSEYAVTQRLWLAVMGKLPDQLTDNRLINPRYPVIFVSWEKAVRFCQTLNDILGLTDQYGYRLPTEAEWEYAARAGTTTDYGFEGDVSELGKYAWYMDNAEGHPQVVGQKLPNRFGLYDMHGNVWEWCQDHFHTNYKGAPIDGSAWEDDDKTAVRVFRGGSWYNSADICRSAFRGRGTLGLHPGSLGFRLSRTLPSALLPSRRD